jgi:dihydropteroate synthase
MRIYLLVQPQSAGLAREMEQLKVDPSGVDIMRSKSQFYGFKIRGISAIAANIIKQDLLSCGGEAALPRNALYGREKSVDILVFGTRKHFTELIDKLKQQPFGLKECSAKLAETFSHLEKPLNILRVGPKNFDLNKKTLLMGILNVTPDSFSDGGKFFDPDLAVAHARQMLMDGADIIDIGAESSRPGAGEISAKKELERLLPVLKTLLRIPKILISIDTVKAAVAEKCLSLGAHLINDISGLKADKKMAGVIARHKVPVVLMHRSGKSRIMQKRTDYQDVVTDIIDSLQESIDIALRAGISRKKIIIDPGIGFGKTTEQNLRIFQRLVELKLFGLPIMIGASRKSMIGNILGTDVSDRLEGSLALTSLAVQGGAGILRVHDVKENLLALKICDAVRTVPRT